MRTVQPARPITPGVYEAEVTDASVRAFDFRVSDGNPHGLAVRLSVDLEASDGPATLFDAVDVSNTDRLREVYEAASLPFDPQECLNSVHLLVGRRVSICSKNIVPAQGKHAGREKAVVSSWLPAAE